MARPENRSKFTVFVPRKPALTRRFAFSRHDDAQHYLASLLAQGLPATVTQDDDVWYVRIRRKGHPAQAKTFQTFEEADAFIKVFEAGESTGLVRDYTAAAKVTLAHLIERYIKDECPRHKGGDNYALMLRAMVEDSTHELRKRLRAREQEKAATGQATTKRVSVRAPMECLEWLQLPFSEVTPVHIEDFVQSRLDDVMPATVDRQLDLLRSVFKVATTTWGYELNRNPMAAVRSPKYFNERDRRVSDDEEDRLLEAARHEDREWSLEQAVQAVAAERIAAGKRLPTHYQRVAAVKAAYDDARRQVQAAGFTHFPRYEAFVLFQLGTAARRGETLKLLRANVDTEAQTAFLPETKNNRPRKLAVRTDLLELLDELPKESVRVFDIGVKELANAWRRMCERARLNDLRMHDLRHEAISRAAESGLFPTVVDLQAFSGHRDIRSLLRYTHLCATRIAQTLDRAEAARRAHRGRQRVKPSEMPVQLAGALATGADAAALMLPAAVEQAVAAESNKGVSDEGGHRPGAKVIPLRRRAAGAR